jgi:hypothetical protein
VRHSDEEEAKSLEVTCDCRHGRLPSCSWTCFGLGMSACLYDAFKNVGKRGMRREERGNGGKGL